LPFATQTYDKQGSVP